MFEKVLKGRFVVLKILFQAPGQIFLGLNFFRDLSNQPTQDNPSGQDNPKILWELSIFRFFIRCSSGVKTKGGRYAHCFYHEKTCKIPKSYHDSPTGKLAGGWTILGHF